MSQRGKEIRGGKGGGRETYDVVKRHPALGVFNQVVDLVLLVDFGLLDGSLEHEHEGLGDADVPVLDDAVGAALALDAHAPAAAMAGGVLDESAGGEDAAELLVDGGKGNCDGGGHSGVCLSTWSVGCWVDGAKIC